MGLCGNWGRNSHVWRCLTYDRQNVYRRTPTPFVFFKLGLSLGRLFCLSTRKSCWNRSATLSCDCIILMHAIPRCLRSIPRACSALRPYCDWVGKGDVRLWVFCSPSCHKPLPSREPANNTSPTTTGSCAVQRRSWPVICLAHSDDAC
jgi:hypothetical protein